MENELLKFLKNLSSLIVVAVAILLICTIATIMLPASMADTFAQIDEIFKSSPIISGLGSVEILFFVISLLIFSVFSSIEPLASIVLTVFFAGFNIFDAQPYLVNAIQSNISNGASTYEAASKFSILIFLLYFIVLFNGLIGLCTPQSNDWYQVGKGIFISAAISLFISLITMLMAVKFIEHGFAPSGVLFWTNFIIIAAAFICDFINWRIDNPFIKEEIDKYIDTNPFDKHRKV